GLVGEVAAIGAIAVQPLHLARNSEGPRNDPEVRTRPRESAIFQRAPNCAAGHGVALLVEALPEHPRHNLKRWQEGAGPIDARGDGFDESLVDQIAVESLAIPRPGQI